MGTGCDSFLGSISSTTVVMFPYVFCLVDVAVFFILHLLETKIITMLVDRYYLQSKNLMHIS